MTISVVCPICNETLTVEFDGTLYGILAIDDLALMELTAPAEVSKHVDSHRTLNEAGSGFEMDPRYWVRLRHNLELRRDRNARWLESLRELGR